MTEFFVYLITIVGIWGILSLSLNLQFGIAGLVNLGHVVFFMLGAYTSTILVVIFAVPIALGMAAGAVTAALFGMLLALPAANLREDYWAITTLAAAEIVRIIFLNTRLGGPYVGEAFGVSGIPRPLREWFEAHGYSLADYNLFYMALVLVCLAAAFILVRYIAAAPIGRSWKSLREGDEVPLALGKAVGGLRIRVMALGGALGGLAGALFAHYNAYIAPEYFLPLETFIVWSMVILGGAGNFLGALAGTLIIQALYNSTRFLAPFLDIEPQILGPLRMIAISVLTILIILFLPRGIIPERRRRYGR